MVAPAMTKTIHSHCNARRLTAATRRDLVVGGFAAMAVSACGKVAWAQPSAGGPASALSLVAGRTEFALGGDRPETLTVAALSNRVPGPTLRTRPEVPININLINTIDATIPIRWHGLRATPRIVPPAVSVGSGGEVPVRILPPDAGTFWYSAWPRRPDTQAQGLYGFLIVDEKTPADIDGDVTLALDEWLLPSGRRIVTANGSSPADFPVRAGERIRLRILNAASRRVMRLQLDRHRVWVMAIDGQPAEPFAAREGRVSLAPGNRIDLFVDAALEPKSIAPVMLDDRQGPQPVARLVYRDEPPRPPRADGPPAPLPPNALPARIDFRSAARPELVLGAVAADRPAFSVRRGRAVVLALTNRTEAPNVVHLQAHPARLLDRLDDGWKPFWLDTLVVAAGQTERVAFAAETVGRWGIDVTPLASGADPSTLFFEVG